MSSLLLIAFWPFSRLSFPTLLLIVLASGFFHVNGAGGFMSQSVAPKVSVRRAQTPFLRPISMYPITGHNAAAKSMIAVWRAMAASQSWGAEDNGAKRACDSKPMAARMSASFKGIDLSRPEVIESNCIRQEPVGSARKRDAHLMLSGGRS